MFCKQTRLTNVIAAWEVNQQYQNVAKIIIEQWNKQKWKWWQSGTYLSLTRASSGPQVSVAKTYRDEMKRKCEYFSQIIVAFLNSRIQLATQINYRGAAVEVLK